MENTGQNVHPSYSHISEAVVILPQALSALYNLKACFGEGGEDFLAVEIRIMLDRLVEIEEILLNGDKG
jgi:hypothetical protein